MHLLRPHHGMCLAFFAGRGYSDAFIQNMARMKTLLESGATIRLTKSPDCICAACPNLRGTSEMNKNPFCLYDEKVEQYDRRVLEILHLQEKSVLNYLDYSKMVQSKILTPGLRSAICGSCQWNQLCK